LLTSLNGVSRNVFGERLAGSNFPDIKRLVRFAGEKGIHDSYVIIASQQWRFSGGLSCLLPTVSDKLTVNVSAAVNTIPVRTSF
jgi:hypothetical protein